MQATDSKCQSTELYGRHAAEMSSTSRHVLVAGERVRTELQQMSY